jgi:hypothetical protein
MLGLTNLYIDAENNVRSYNELSLPSTGLRKKVSLPGIPSPKSKDSENIETVKIARLPVDIDFRIIIMDYGFNTSLRIGEIDIDNDEIISIITSDLGTISLFYYPSDVRFTGAIEKWLSMIVNSLETLLPSKLGSIIDVLTYAINNREEYPVDFEQTIIKTILSSHEVYFEVLRDPTGELQEYLMSKYDSSDVELMLDLLSHIEDNPGVPLLNYAITHEPDLVHLISIFLMLELEEIVQIHRPGIIEII